MTKETELLRPHIESTAVDMRPDWDGQVRLSVAISLKRIADALAPAEGPRLGEQLGIDIGAQIQMAIGNALFEEWRRTH